MIIGVPVIRRYDLLWRFLKSLERCGDTGAQVVIVDNGEAYYEQSWYAKAPCSPQVIRTGRNVGCAGAWNLLLERAKSRQLGNVHSGEEHVIIANDDIMLAPDSIARIAAAAPQADLVAGYGFSLFLMHTRLLDEVGPFDENFFPAYFEDNDYSYRMKLAGRRFHVVDGCAQHTGSASLHILSDAAQREFGKRFEELRAYYVKKWGGRPTEERFTTPFNGNIPPGWRLRPETG